MFSMNQKPKVHIPVGQKFSFKTFNPPKNLAVDYQKTSDSLASLGLGCELNTPQKIEQYAKAVASNFPSEKISHFIGNLLSSSNDYDYTVDDTDPLVIQMNRIFAKREDLQAHHEIIFNYNVEEKTFKDSTENAIQNIFSDIANVIGNLPTGHIDHDQLLKMISNEVEKTTSEEGYSTEQFHFIVDSGAVTNPDGSVDCDIFGGVQYKYSYHISDITNKKSTTQESHYKVEQWSLSFSNYEDFNRIYNLADKL